MIDYLDTLIGDTYANQPVPYILCVMLIIWFIYQLFTLMYGLLGVKK